MFLFQINVYYGVILMCFIDFFLIKYQELIGFLDRLGYFGRVYKQGVYVWIQILYVGQDCDLDVWVIVSQRFIKDY